ncbi:MAG: P1 family peptidase [Gemmatimonadetes bacterium]|nr:P1 family peptidase [Gemmatimonadota bacterium]
MLALAGPASALPQDIPAGSITEVAGIRVGHWTHPDAPTGCTVVIADGGAVGGVDQRGGAPGTVETDLLDPLNTVQTVNAIFLSGGSAYGLVTHDGVMRYLEERGEGYPVGRGLVVPIVPGAIIFDLHVADNVRPGPDCGYEAASAASTGAVAEGSVGAGAGATVGKLRGIGRAMKGGVGTASITLESGLTVAALVVVNALGDVIDPATGRVIAGVRGDGDVLVDARRILREEVPAQSLRGNTTIGVVATNARLTKAQATKVAQMAQNGLARAIVPVHTPSDGDTVFSLATGTLADGFDVGQVGALAAEVMAEAILRAVRAATGLPSIPAVRDLPGAGNHGDPAAGPTAGSSRSVSSAGAVGRPPA